MKHVLGLALLSTSYFNRSFLRGNYAVERQVLDLDLRTNVHTSFMALNETSVVCIVLRISILNHRP